MASESRGRALFASNGCAACHGSDGRAQIILRDGKLHYGFIEAVVARVMAGLPAPGPTLLT